MADHIVPAQLVVQQRGKSRGKQRRMGRAGGEIIDLRQLSLVRQAVPDGRGGQLVERMGGVLLFIQCIMAGLDAVDRQDLFLDAPFADHPAQVLVDALVVDRLPRQIGARARDVTISHFHLAPAPVDSCAIIRRQTRRT